MVRPLKDIALELLDKYTTEKMYAGCTHGIGYDRLLEEENKYRQEIQRVSNPYMLTLEDAKAINKENSLYYQNVHYPNASGLAILSTWGMWSHHIGFFGPDQIEWDTYGSTWTLWTTESI